MQVKSKTSRLLKQPAELVELPVRKADWGIRFLQLDSLVRNFVVVGGLVLVLVAVKNSTVPETKSVFSAIQESTGMKWDESVGKLSFVNSFLPEEIQEVWNETNNLTVYAPSDGNVIHLWSRQEPYMLIEGNERDVYAAADGEVMSIAHGLNEEQIVRIRHEDCETVYGNVEECLVEVGDQVLRGDTIGTLIANQPLAFELRYKGRSVDPALHIKSLEE